MSAKQGPSSEADSCKVSQRRFMFAKTEISRQPVTGSAFDLNESSPDIVHSSFQIYFNIVFS